MTVAGGLILSASASGTGKTTVTLAILAALARTGKPVRAAKSGPDYIDPCFHALATGGPCVTLDAWAMTPVRIRALAQGPGTLIIEGAMGLFDGAPPDGRGATADLAQILGLPVVLILDVAKQAQSAAALAEGFVHHSADVRVAGLILNRVGSLRHRIMLRRALEPLGLPVLGAVPQVAEISRPSRHLGLMQAAEHPDLEAFMAKAADVAADNINLDLLTGMAAPLPVSETTTGTQPPAQRLAVARDEAFAFVYPHLLADWRRAGAEVQFFSPLADEAPPEADLVILPGGYPELHAGRLAANRTFMNGLRDAPAVYGECGGYMVLGDGLIDADGTRHPMAGLLRLETSFEKRRLHIGYRTLQADTGPFPGTHTGHEFHYATTLKAEGAPLFTARDAEGTILSPMGLCIGRISGSFAHIIDSARSGGSPCGGRTIGIPLAP
ncbi:MAG: cobyrinate a,c-diamide synthase [Rhodobacteraceae bacterium]|nr:cobyrinate a,c-diamide synthase [Paracoccaceae bacterium]